MLFAAATVTISFERAINRQKKFDFSVNKKIRFFGEGFGGIDY